MKSLILAVMLSVGWVLPACAGSYDEFSQGVSASDRGDEDAAIQHLSAALAANDLLPSLRPTAYFDRAQAYIRQKRLQDAVSDLKAAIQLDPSRAEAHAYLASAYIALGQADLALTECGSATMPNRYSGVFGMCGRIYWMAGKYSEAGAEFEKEIKFTASRRAPHLAYVALWLELSQLKAGSTDDSKFASTVDNIAIDDWPRPILELYLGKTTPEAVVSAAASGDAADLAGQMCETGFYVGEWQLLHNNLSGAKSFLEKAVSTCPKNFIELAPAEAELAKLK